MGSAIAVDLGAESGRVCLVGLENERARLQEVGRFVNQPVFVAGSLHWDALRIFHDVSKGIRDAKALEPADSVGVDGWGVDYGLIDPKGKLIGNPFHYRDERTIAAFDRVVETLGRERIYRQTGIQLMRINTLYQLAADPPLPDFRLLFMSDLMNYWLSGIAANEKSIASTSQCHSSDGKPCLELLSAIGVDPAIFPCTRPPASILGRSDEFGVEVALPAGHDTACAVAAAPIGENDAYISCGTWALVGIETERPVIDDDALNANVTNEAGAFGTNRLLRNVMGLWLLQRLKIETGIEYDLLLSGAEACCQSAPLIDPDHPSLLAPSSMIEAINRLNGTMHGPDVLAATILKSLALRFRWTIDRLEKLTSRRLASIRMVGGGCKNELLCQWTANATGRPVYAGPSEATAIGNGLLQHAALGRLNSLAEIRSIVTNSFPATEYSPMNGDHWETEYKKFLDIAVHGD